MQKYGPKSKVFAIFPTQRTIDRMLETETKKMLRGFNNEIQRNKIRKICVKWLHSIYFIRKINLCASKPININGLLLRWGSHEKPTRKKNWTHHWWNRLDFGTWLRSKWKRNERCSFCCPLHILIPKAWWEWKWFLFFFLLFATLGLFTVIHTTKRCLWDDDGERTLVFHRCESWCEWFKQNSNYSNNIHYSLVYIHIVFIYIRVFHIFRKYLCKSVSFLSIAREYTEKECLMWVPFKESVFYLQPCGHKSLLKFY